MSTVLVTGARSPAALDIARDLAKAGHEVHMADSSPARISRWSRAPAGVHRLRAPVQDPAGFRSDMVELVERLNPDLVLPTCEEIFHLVAARQQGFDMGPLFAPGADTLDILHAKDRFNALARDIGLDAPESRILRQPVDPSSLDLPRTVLKACYSRFGEGTLIAPSSDQVKRMKPSARAPWIAQRLVAGVEHSSYAVAVDGVVTAFAAYRSTRRLAGGAGYAFRPAAADVSGRMLDASRRIAASLSMTGQISLDAIDDGERSWLIECNPRATSGVHLLAGDGRIARALFGGKSMAECRHGPCHNLPMMLVHALPRRLVRSGRPLDLRGGRDVIGSKGDRLPLLGSVVDTLSFAFRAWTRGLSMTGATTFDIEWNGRR